MLKLNEEIENQTNEASNDKHHHTVTSHSILQCSSEMSQATGVG